ncbi:MULTISPECIES: toprim domain-containing protein [Allobacillus]|uniref:Toprim domain-containing protein n=1 Tax=Allobacillus halotolerans TaxID=570278 RepID=A0ABS6GMW7_9BACI|nr:MULTISPECIES: toprim domain-containing protein [Allobacillus]MBU6080428.1 toprim domain-containing protein [Allobacillus halotolerans]TSJ65911.1 topoisomerase [Allobacillus sp. SKP2-8]
MDELSKVIIVEGKQDKKKIKRVLEDEAFILCTFGTLGLHALDLMIEEHQLDDRDVFILTDEDEPGIKLRKLLNQEISHAQNLYIDRKYREVEETPEYVLASILQAADINVDVDFLKGFE